MMYKDKDKQKEANRERQRRYKAKQKALPEQGVTNEKALLSEGVTGKALPLCPYCLSRPTMSDNAIACEVCSQMTLINPKSKTIWESEPGDEDYDGICTPGWIAERTA